MRHVVSLGEPRIEGVCSGSSDVANNVYVVIHSGYYTRRNASHPLDLVLL